MKDTPLGRLGAGLLLAAAACEPGAGSGPSARDGSSGSAGTIGAAGAAGGAAGAPSAASGGAGVGAEGPDGDLPLDGRAGGGSEDAGAAPRGDAGAPPLVLRGVCWNPVPAGATHPEGLDYAGFADVDIPLMVELGVNVVRTYEPLLDRAVLDRLWAAGIRVIESIYLYGGVEAAVVTERVRAIKDHPAVLYWALGNEWNYNGLYVGLSLEQSLERLNEAAALVRAEDPARPIVTIFGELPSAETIAAMPDVDIWGINAYRGLSFGDLLDAWRALSDKPMFLAEYGADAYDANLPGYAPESQALATEALAREILEQATRPGAHGPVLGGTLFECGPTSGGKIPAAAPPRRMWEGSPPAAAPIPTRSSMKSGGASSTSSAIVARRSSACAPSSRSSRRADLATPEIARRLGALRKSNRALRRVRRARARGHGAPGRARSRDALQQYPIVPCPLYPAVVTGARQPGWAGSRPFLAIECEK